MDENEALIKTYWSFFLYIFYCLQLKQLLHIIRMYCVCVEWFLLATFQFEWNNGINILQVCIQASSLQNSTQIDMFGANPKEINSNRMNADKPKCNNRLLFCVLFSSCRVIPIQMSKSRWISCCNASQICRSRGLPIFLCVH